MKTRSCETGYGHLGWTAIICWRILSGHTRRIPSVDQPPCQRRKWEGTPLTKQAYQLRLEGLREAEGHIRAATLIRALDALVKTAEKATRLAATGRSGGRGAKPRWLKAALDFTVTGLGSGSTTLDIEAPPLGAVPAAGIAQQDFWLQQPDIRDTALDLGARAAAEAQKTGASGDYFDGDVLRAILGLGKAAETPEARYELIPQDPARSGFVLRASACAQIRERLHLIPVPRAFVVSGRLDEIRHGMGRFRLLIDSDRSLPGRLDRAWLDVELLRPLWGKLATVQGMVHFKASGQPRFIEARRITAHAEGDALFETMPEADMAGLEAPLRRAPVKTMRRVDPMVLWGAWPGDESIEELLAELD